MDRNPIEVFGQKGFPETSVTQFCLLSSPLCKKSSWTRFCPHAFQFIFPPASLISYFRKPPNIYILDIFTLDKSWNTPWLSAYMLCASPLWTHRVPSRPFGRTARHPKTQFIPGTASAVLGTGQIVRFLSLWQQQPPWQQDQLSIGKSDSASLCKMKTRLWNNIKIMKTRLYEKPWQDCEVKMTKIE